MGYTSGQHTQSEDQTGNDYLYYTHDTSNQIALTGVSLVDDGADWAAMLQPLTDTELRASAVPVTVSGVSTEAKQPTVYADGPSGKDGNVQFGVAVVSGDAAPLLTDSDGRQYVINNGTFAVQVAGVSTEAKQDTLIGHVDGVESGITDAVTALQIMDDWDETNRAKVNLIVGQAGIAAGSGAAGANTPRVILASDSPLPTGSATAANQLTANTALAAIQAALEILDNIVSGSEAQVDVVASLPAGTNAIGKLAANSGVDIGDVDVTSLPAELSGPGTPSIDNYTSAAINLSAGTANQTLVAAPGANKQIWVYGIVLTADVDGTVSIQDEDDTAITGVMPVAANGGFGRDPSGNFAMPLWKVATNKALECDTVTCAADGDIQYAIVDVS